MKNTLLRSKKAMSSPALSHGADEMHELTLDRTAIIPEFNNMLIILRVIIFSQAHTVLPQGHLKNPQQNTSERIFLQGNTYWKTKKMLSMKMVFSTVPEH